MTELNLSDLLKSVKIAKTDWMGLRFMKEEKRYHTVRDGKPDGVGSDISRGLLIEVLVDGHFGYAATQELTKEALQQAAERAYMFAKTAGQWGLFKGTEALRPTVKGSYKSPCEKPYDSLSVTALYDQLLSICQDLRSSSKIIKSAVMAQFVLGESESVSTSGSHVKQTFNSIMTHMEAIAREGAEIQRRTDNGYVARTYQRGLEAFDGDAMRQRAAKISQQAVELLGARDCPVGTKTVVIAPDQMMLQIHESIGHPLELDRILGDERNYAGFSFVRPHDFGKMQYGSKLLNVTFDPSFEGESASYAFDECGNKATKEFLIQDGVLVRALGSLESQARSKVPGVANYRSCAWNRAPIDRMANLNIEPGDKSFDQIIGQIEDGVYMETNRSWSIDDYRNKFQFGCEYAREIKNGKLGDVLKNPNYRGVTNAFWNNLIAVGDTSTLEVYGAPNCGKGEPNQSIRVGHASPVCAFHDIEVFGGAV